MKTKIEELRDKQENRRCAQESVCDKLEKLSQDGFVVTGHVIGRGNRAKIVDVTDQVVIALKRLQINHSVGNNAPRGGMSGKYVIITEDALMDFIGKSETYIKLRNQAGPEWKYEE